MKLIQLFEASTGWIALNVVKDILGANNVLDIDINPNNLNDDQIEEYWKTHEIGNRVAVTYPEHARFKAGSNGFTPFNAAYHDEDGYGEIFLEEPLGTSPHAVAVAAHEACHALLFIQNKNHSDERLVNQMATEWLQRHLSGIALHAAVESILGSKIHYGHN